MTPEPGQTAGGEGAAVAAVRVRQAVALLRAAATQVETFDAAAAVSMAGLFAEAWKIAHAATVRCGVAAGDVGARRCAGSKNAASLLSSLSGTSVAKAKASLDVARRAALVRALKAPFSNGDLSIDQVAVIVPAAERSSAAAATLLEAARSVSIDELRSQAALHLQRARGEAATVLSERQLHARRYCRTWVPKGGGLRIDALVGHRDGAAFLAALNDEHDRLQRASRLAGAGVVPERLRADALVGLVTAARGNATGAGRPEMLVRVDAAALVRGSVTDGETCEIDGIGPVSVEAARGMLGEALLTVLVHDGVDIKTVTSATRYVPKRVENALLARDTRCVVPGCGTTSRLEIDHWATDFAWNGPTALENLCRICVLHHRLKTRTGWRLTGGPGRWRWLPPKSRDQLAEEHAQARRRRLDSGGAERRRTQAARAP